MKNSCQAIKELQTSVVIEHLVKDNNLSIADATRLWYNSKTKKIMHDSGKDYSFVSPMRCYDELMMEMTGHPRWMRGQFV